MTERRIRDVLTFLEARKLEAIRIAGDLGDLAEMVRVRLPEIRLGELVGTRLERLAQDVASELVVLDRLIDKDTCEDTQPILLTGGYETCSRCQGTGEVPKAR